MQSENAAARSTRDAHPYARTSRHDAHPNLEDYLRGGAARIVHCFLLGRLDLARWDPRVDAVLIDTAIWSRHALQLLVRARVQAHQGQFLRPTPAGVVVIDNVILVLGSRQLSLHSLLVGVEVEAVGLCYLSKGRVGCVEA